jgi:hypothetical protein
MVDICRREEQVWERFMVAILETSKLEKVGNERLVDIRKEGVKLFQKQQNNDAKDVPDLQAMVEQYVGVSRPVRAPQRAAEFESV